MIITLLRPSLLRTFLRMECLAKPTLASPVKLLSNKYLRSLSIRPVVGKHKHHKMLIGLSLLGLFGMDKEDERTDEEKLIHNIKLGILAFQVR